jgi:hypothetical protein
MGVAVKTSLEPSENIFEFEVSADPLWTAISTVPKDESLEKAVAW